MRRLFVAIVLLAATTLPASAGLELWTPSTGETTLEELPRDTPEQRRRHALALLGAGQLSGGEPLLRELMNGDPKGEWVVDARFALARASIAPACLWISAAMSPP